MTCAIAFGLTLMGGCLAACSLSFTDEEDAGKPDAELSAVFDKFETPANWNFSVKFSEMHEGVQSRSAVYDYMGRDLRGIYSKNGKDYTDYFGYDSATKSYQYYCDMGNGNYTVYKQGTVNYSEGRNAFYEIDPSALGNYAYTKIDDHYSAKDPDAVGGAVVEELPEGNAWNAFNVYIKDGLLDRIVARKLDGDIWIFTFSDYGKVSFTLPKMDGGTTDPDTPDTPTDLSSVLAKYEDISKWNFAITFRDELDGEVYEEYYEYLGYNVLYQYEDEYGECTDYLGYDMASDSYTYYWDMGDGTYEALPDDDEYFEEMYYYMLLIDPYTLFDLEFTQENGKYSAKDPAAAGNAMIGELSDEEGTTYTWVSFDVYISGGYISKIVAVMNDGDIWIFTFSDYGTVNFTLPKMDGGTTKPDEPDDPVTPDELAAVVEKFANRNTWNFVVEYEEVYDDEIYTQETYEYLGYNVKNTYPGYDIDTGDYLGEYTDYLGYDKATGKHTYYSQLDDGSYESIVEGDTDYDDYYVYLHLVDLSALSEVSFTKSGSYYVLQDPETDAEKLLGEYYYDYDGYGLELVAWTDVKLYISNGNVTKIVAELEDTTVSTYTFSNYGKVSFTLPGGSSTDPVEPDDPDEPVVDPNMMTKQTYDAATFDNERLQDKMAKDKSSNGLPSIGLPSKGTYHALVVPVQFKGDTISSTQLSNLNKAFNGTSADTGWQSVSSYYKTASNGLLNLTFDIQSTVALSYNSSYYEYQTEYYEGETYSIGDLVILEETLKKLDSTIDFSKYDTNNDGYIDAVYLIYSASVNYNSDESIYWAYVYWSQDDTTRYDGKLSNYYLFAGFDFMDESTSRQDSSLYDNYPVISGLKINASTYIHESGHLMGLDDYYDYDEGLGSDEGLGYADMMDGTIGDHGVYSKIMLGWLDATVVNSTQTITIQASAQTPSTTPSVLLIPLNFDNSYFSEYLLIDLYSATGLNEMHANMKDTFLYDGAPYGARIYHISSSINDPYSTERYTFTDNDNSSTANALIKLVEADGDKKFSSGNGYAEADDLWQTGGVFSQKFPSYTRNDGKKVNFDISFDSVTSTSATITVTFKN